MTNNSYVGTVGNITTLVIGVAFFIVSAIGIAGPAQANTAAPAAGVHNVAR